MTALWEAVCSPTRKQVAYRCAGHAREEVWEWVWEWGHRWGGEGEGVAGAEGKAGSVGS
jgi:hypothetical protein